MQILFLALALINGYSANAAVCSRTLTFVDGAVLSAAQLNAEFNAITNCSNSLDNANLTTSANILPSKLNSTIAGDGIGRNGSTGVLSVNVDDSTIELDSDNIQLKDDGIVASKIANNAVTTTKVLDDAITEDKIADNAVTTNKIADGSVTAAKLSAGAAFSAGMVMPFAGTSAPTGWLEANGAAVSRITYSGLYAVIGVTHGNGDGFTTFNLPDYRGRFLRGLDGSAGRDPDSGTRTAMNPGGVTGNNVGSVQSDQFRAHTHTYTGSITFSGSTDFTTGGSSGLYVPASVSGSTGGNETRPINANVLYMIKY